MTWSARRIGSPRVVAFKPGDVLAYTPREYHCCEGTAFVTENGTPLDTFWGPDGDGQYGRLREEELATAEIKFNVNDYDALDRYSKGSAATWKTYHPDDRALITSQHRLQHQFFIRKGAKPDLSTQIENAQAAVEDAESELRSAEARLGWRRQELAELQSVSSVVASVEETNG